MKTKMTFQQFFTNQEKITRAYLAQRDNAPRNFWCHTQQASDFCAYWDKKWTIIQKHFNRQWQRVCAENKIEG